MDTNDAGANLVGYGYDVFGDRAEDGWKHDRTQTTAASWTYTVKDLSGTVTLGHKRRGGAAAAQWVDDGAGADHRGWATAYYDAGGGNCSFRTRAKWRTRGAAREASR